MRLKYYISSKIITLCFLGIADVFLLVIMLMLEANTALILMAELGLLLLVLLWLLISYYIEAKHIKRLERIIAQLDKKYLLGEVLQEPTNDLEQQYYDIMKIISRSAIAEVEKAQREKDEYCEYVENWIHEIKTPLTSCSLIIDNDGDIHKLRRELKRAENLTENILYYARLKAAYKDTIIHKFNVRSIIDNAIKSQMELLIAANIGVEVQGDFDINSDDKALEFIIKQLLINSAKYCNGCKIKINNQNGIITFEDNGIGIPEHEIARVTERGFTGTNGRRLGTSTGMGLYIVNKLCERLNISFKIESEEEKYTRIYIIYQ